MATQIADTFVSPVPLPFLLRGSGPEAQRGGFHAALEAAVSAADARGALRKPCQRIALFLCELGKALGCRAELPLSRSSIAGLLGISVVRVKRTLALLTLSGVIRSDGDRITILDWRKLSGVARFDPAELNIASEDSDDLTIGAEPEDQTHRFLTASGDPACFV